MGRAIRSGNDWVAAGWLNGDMSPGPSAVIALVGRDDEIARLIE